MEKRARFHRNLVLKVKGYDLGTNRNHCYPGSVTGEVIGGPLNGRTVSVSLQRTHSNEKVLRIPDLGNPEAENQFPPGSYLAFSTVRELENDFRANWVNKFAGPEAELRVNVPIQIAPTIEIGGGIRRFKSNNATMYRAFILDTHKTTSSEHPCDVHKAVEDCFTNGNAAFLRLMDPDLPRKTMVLWRGLKDGKPVPVKEAVLNELADPILAKLESIHERGGKFDVMPLESVFVCPATAESIDNGVFSNIAIRDYCTGGLGYRIEAALMKKSTINVGELRDHFYKSLDKHAQGAFDEYGWTGIWTSDIEKYIRDMDIEPPKVPTYGYALSTAVIKEYTSEDFGGTSRFLTKTRSTGPVVPRDYVSTPSDPDAVYRFEEGFAQLVRDLHAGIERSQDYMPEQDEETEDLPTPSF